MLQSSCLLQMTHLSSDRVGVQLCTDVSYANLPPLCAAWTAAVLLLSSVIMRRVSTFSLPVWRLVSVLPLGRLPVPVPIPVPVPGPVLFASLLPVLLLSLVVILVAIRVLGL